jgi:hypothetical protein
MGADAKTQELRDLAGLARKLREYAVQTDDAHYIAMFLATAETLEARAAALGQTTVPRADAAPRPAHLI